MAAQKYFIDEKGKDFFIKSYDGTSICVIKLSRHFCVPRHTIHDWAIKFGVSRPTRRHWSEKEVSYLSRNWGKKSVEEITKALRRTEPSVRVKANILGISKCDGMSAQELCEALGCVHTTIERWLRDGMLKGKQVTRNSPWQFSNRQIRDFIRSYPNEVNPKKLNPNTWLWLVNILSEDGLGDLGTRKKVEKE